MKLLLTLALSFSALLAGAQKDTIRVYFDFDRYELTPAARIELQQKLDVLKQQQKPVAISGHCDALGSHAYNDALSRKRAEAVKQQLQLMGIPSETIGTVTGQGKRAPLNANSTDEERSRNRRVDIIIDIPAVTQVQEPEKPREFSRETIETIKAGDNLVLPHINFQGGLHRFLPSSMPHLQELLDVLKKYPTLEIEIQGHICCRPGDASDGIDLETGRYDLSMARAKAVFEYLVEHGIDKNRLRFRGFAGSKPLVYPETSESDRTANRRVEILILKK